MKAAFLVEFNPCTRVVVDVPEGFSLGKFWEDMTEEEHEAYDYIVQAAREKIFSQVEQYINGDNIAGVEEDTECPYGTFNEDYN